MTLAISKKLIENGQFQEALDVQWNDIDSGNEAARLTLASLFDDLGLHYFSQDHYLYLLDNKPDFADEAATGAVRNNVWMRNYPEAKNLLGKNPTLQKTLATYVSESQANFSTLSKPDEFLVEVVTQILADQDLVYSRYFENPNDENFDTKLSLQEWLFNISLDLSYTPNVRQSSISIEVPVAGGFGVSRSIASIAGNPIGRARNYLISCADQIGRLADLTEIEQSQNNIFLEACLKGKSIANKFLLLSVDEEDLSDEDSQLMENICWGLSRLTSTDQNFSAYVLGGVTN